MGTGRPSWLVVLGPCLPFMVLGPRHHWWVVLVPCRQLQVVLLGPHHFSWVEWLGAGRIVHGWWWCALVGFRAAWPLSLSWWSCPRSRERVVGHSCLWTLHPSSSCIGVLHRFHVPSSRILVVMCPRHCHVSLIIVVCPRCVIVPCPPHCYPMMLLLPCPHCDMSFDCQ